MVEYLRKLVPPHSEYVEVFGGGASLLFAKKPSPVEVYNDIDEGLANFFRVMRDIKCFRRFHRAVRWTPYSRQEHVEARSWMEQEDPVERARMWFILARQSFGGNFFGNSWGFAVSGEHGSSPPERWISAIEGLREVHERLKHVQVENLDWRRCLELYRMPTTLLYCDPPYLPETRKAGGYAHELTEKDHEDLLDALHRFPGMVMLSGYDNDLYRMLEEFGWERNEHPMACMVAGRTRKKNKETGELERGDLQGAGAVKERQPRLEIVWRNPRAAKAARQLDLFEQDHNEAFLRSISDDGDEDNP